MRTARALTLSRGGGYLVPGDVLSPRGVYLVPGEGGVLRENSICTPWRYHCARRCPPVTNATSRYPEMSAPIIILFIVLKFKWQFFFEIHTL